MGLASLSMDAVAPVRSRGEEQIRGLVNQPPSYTASELSTLKPPLTRETRQAVNNSCQPSCDWLKASCEGLKASLNWLGASCDWLKASCDWLKASCEGLKASCDWLKASCEGLRASCDGLKVSQKSPLQELLEQFTDIFVRMHAHQPGPAHPHGRCLLHSPSSAAKQKIQKWRRQRSS